MFTQDSPEDIAGLIELETRRMAHVDVAGRMAGKLVRGCTATNIPHRINSFSTNVCMKWYIKPNHHCVCILLNIFYDTIECIIKEHGKESKTTWPLEGRDEDTVVETVLKFVHDYRQAHMDNAVCSV